jgi:3-oxoacyl-[acyl-carrier protein] reductase
MANEVDLVVAITGASSGIGAASAEALVGAGAKVVLGARRGERLDALVRALGEERAVAVPMDVRSPQDCERLISVATERFGRLNALVASAGIGIYGGIIDLTDEQCTAMMDTNFAGTVWPVRAAVPALMATGNGDVVIVASVAGIRGGAHEVVYAGTKAAQVGLGGALDRELRPKGIRVTTLCPATVDTEFAIGTGRRADDPDLKTALRATDVAHAVLTVLTQPSHVRTTDWVIRPMSQAS